MSLNKKIKKTEQNCPCPQGEEIQRPAPSKKVISWNHPPEGHPVDRDSGRAYGDGPKVTERAQNADFRRKPQIFADSTLLLEIPAFGGRRKPQKTADFRRTPKIFEKTTGNCRLASVTLGPSPLARP